MQFHSDKSKDDCNPRPGPHSYSVSLFSDKYDNTPAPHTKTWDELIATVKAPVVRAMKDGPLFSPASFKEPHRLNEQVNELSLLILDYDHDAIWLEDFKPWQALGLRFFAYTSHSHLRKTDCNPKAEPRFRVCIPLKETIPAERFPLLWQWAKLISGEKIDENVKDLSRMYYLPAKASQNAPYEWYVNKGNPLDWQAAIDSLPDDVVREISKDAGKRRRAQKAKVTRPDVINLEECEPITDPIVLQVVNGAKKRIAESIPGEQHFRRLKEGRLLGGLVPHIMTYEQAYNALAPEVQKTALDFHKAMKDIEWGLCYGMVAPIRYEELKARYEPADITIEAVEDDPQPESDGQIIDDDYDPPVSDDPDREKYLRQMLLNSSQMTRARMMVAAALGFSKAPWRFLNAIHSFGPSKKQPHSLGIKIISDEMLASRYRESDEKGTSLDTIKRDRRKLRKQQEKIGVLLIEIWPGWRNQATGETFATKYLSHLDRWALQAIDLATEQKGTKFYTYGMKLQKAAKSIAASIPRNPISYNGNSSTKPSGDYHALTIGIKKYLEKRGKELTSAAVVERIETNQVLSDLTNLRLLIREVEKGYLAKTHKLSYDDEPLNIIVEDDDLSPNDPQGTISPPLPSTDVEEGTISPPGQSPHIGGNSAPYVKESVASSPNVNSTTYKKSPRAAQCDHCGKPISAGAVQCEGCGAFYTHSYWKTNYGIAEGVG